MSTSSANRSALARLPLSKHSSDADWLSDSGYRLLKQKIQYASPQKAELVRQAYLFAADAHSGQTRLSGEPYISHPVAVASILAEFRMDAYGLCAALLHDVLEDCDVSRIDLGRRFGPLVSRLVVSLSKLSHNPNEDVAEYRRQSMRNLLAAMARDRRTIIIKLADRLHNIRTLQYMSAESRRRIARETLDIYAPIARRVGLYAFYRELADKSFTALYPLRSTVLHRRVAQWREESRQAEEQMSSRLTEALHASGIRAQIRPLDLSYFSTYRRLRSQGYPLSEILGGPRLLIVTENRNDCYMALGLVHGAFTPRHGRVQDFIAVTKTNNYQSLHTEVNCGGKWSLVAIRSSEMDRISRLGILAGRPSSGPSRQLSQNLRALTSNYRPSEFLRNVRDDLRSASIVAFSEDGSPVHLSQGATALDFIFALDPKIAHHAVGCTMDGRKVPLSAEVYSSAKVIVTRGEAVATRPVWLEWASTRLAREEIRQTLNALHAERARGLGRQALEVELRRYKLDLSQMQQARGFVQHLRQFGVSSLEQLLEQVGTGERLAAPLAAQICGQAPIGGGNREADSVTGIDGIAVTFARCCYPLPGDTIRGQIRQKVGLVVHRRNCRNALRSDDKSAPFLLDWSQGPAESFTSALNLQLEDRAGALSDITATIAKHNVNISDIHLSNGDHSCFLELQISSRELLWRLMGQLRSLPSVRKAQRLPKLED